MRLAAARIAIGLGVSVAITRLLSSLLFGVTANDPLTFSAVAALLALVAVLASYIPVVRALRLEPTSALRCK